MSISGHGHIGTWQYWDMANIKTCPYPDKAVSWRYTEIKNDVNVIKAYRIRFQTTQDVCICLLDEVEVWLRESMASSWMAIRIHRLVDVKWHTVQLDTWSNLDKWLWYAYLRELIATRRLTYSPGRVESLNAIKCTIWGSI